jgi:hypothetical protein
MRRSVFCVETSWQRSPSDDLAWTVSDRRDSRVLSKFRGSYTRSLTLSTTLGRPNTASEIDRQIRTLAANGIGPLKRMRTRGIGVAWRSACSTYHAKAHRLDSGTHLIDVIGQMRGRPHHAPGATRHRRHVRLRRRMSTAIATAECWRGRPLPGNFHSSTERQVLAERAH